MSRAPVAAALVDRVLRKLGLRRRPPEPTVFPDDLDPGVGVREPRRPRPSRVGRRCRARAAAGDRRRLESGVRLKPA